MGALSRPDLPEGPLRTLFDDLHDLHHRAGWPSLRDLARAVGTSRTTVSAAFSEPRLPRWGLLELLVEALRGDPVRFHDLWLAASGGASGPVPPPAASALPGPAVAVVRQLPPDVPGFTGRQDILADLSRGLLSATRFVVLAGTAGVGKTALALHWAHRHASAFPDGQLYADLRGYDPDQPVPVADLLAEFLRALGVEGAGVPHGLPERTARLRSLLSDRRMLVFLDNAHAEDQVRPLLPGSDTCAVLVTSRDALAGLVVRDGAIRIGVPLMAPEEGLRLLRTLTGPRVDAEPAAARALGERCAWLPLALRVTAEFAASRPRSTFQDLVAEFDSEPRLDMLAAGDDEHTAVRSVLSWSYRHLRPEVARLFRALGRHPRRLAAHYVERTREAVSAAEAGPGTLPPATAGPAPPPSAALEWLDTERPVLLRLARELPDHAGELWGLLAAFLDTGGHYSDALALHGSAVLAAERSGDGRARADALDRLGTVRRRIGRYAEAQIDHQAAAAAYREAGDRAGLGRALQNLGVVGWRSGRYREAREHLHEAVDLHRAAGDRSAEGGALYSLGIVYRRLGDYPAALEFHGQALTILREVGDRAGEGRALNNSGVVYLRLGRYDEARAVLERALVIQRERRDRAGESVALVNLGLVCERTGRYDEASRHLEDALRLARTIGYRAGEAEALRGLGVVRGRLGDRGQAELLLRRALGLGREIGDADVEIGALNELAELLGRADEAADVAEAGELHRRALALARDSGDRVEEARARAGLAAVAARATESSGSPGRPGPTR